MFLDQVNVINPTVDITLDIWLKARSICCSELWTEPLVEASLRTTIALAEEA